jgi:hypothetical protein
MDGLLREFEKWLALEYISEPEDDKISYAIAGTIRRVMEKLEELKEKYHVV